MSGVVPRRRSLVGRLGAALGRAFSNPIFAKDVTVSGRRRWTYVARFVYPALLLGVLTLVYWAIAKDHGGRSDIAQIQESQRIAPALTLAVGWVQFVAVTLIAPLLTCGSICDERRAGTLSVLMTTPLSSFRIALGKLSAGLVQMLVLVFAGLPVLLGIRVFGGVSVESIVAIEAVSISTAILAAVLGLFYSVSARRATTAAASAIVMLVAYQGAISLAITGAFAYFQAQIGTGGAAGPMANPVMPYMYYIGVFSSPVAMADISATMTEGIATPFAGAWRGNVIYSLSLALVVFLWTVVRLRRRMIKDEGGPAPATARAWWMFWKRRDQALASASSPAGGGALPSRAAARRAAARADSGPVDVGDHPVRWREWRQPTFKSKVTLVVAAIAGVGVLALLHAWAARFNETDEVHMPIAGVASFLTLCVALFAGTGAITNEREGRTLDTLLTTPMSPLRIVWGKFVGGMRRQWFLPGLWGLSISYGVIRGDVSPVLLVHQVLLIVPAVAFVCATGIYFSSVFTKATAAAMANAGVALGLWFGLIVVPLIVFEGIMNTRFGDDLASLAGCINPVGLSVIATDGARVARYGSSVYSGGYRLYDFSSVGRIGFTFVSLLYAGLYAGATYGALHLAARRLAKKRD